MLDPVGQGIVQAIIIASIVAIFIISFKDKGQGTLYSLFIACGICALSAWAFDKTLDDIFVLVQYKPLVVLLCFSVIISVAEQQDLFEYLAIRIIRLTKENLRLLFYMLCLASAAFSAFLEDVTVAIIFVPLIIRTAQLLKIEPVPFIVGVSFSIIVGNLLTAFSSPATILVSELLAVNTAWFFMTFILLFFILIGSVLVLIDLKQVRRMPKPDELQVKMLVEIIDSKILIADRRKFTVNAISLIALFTGLSIIPVPTYLFLIFAVLVIFTVQKESLAKHLKKADWGLILFILAIFLMSACLNISGLLAGIANAFSTLGQGHIIYAVLVIIISTTLIGSFFSKTGAIIIFSSIVMQLPFYGEYKGVLVMAIVIGAVLGGNMIPQASSHMLKVLSMTKERQIDKVTQKMITKNSVIFIALAITVGFLYTIAFVYI